MSNHITIELCAEDRARLDKIAERLEAQITLTQFLIDNGLPAMEQLKPAGTDELTERLKAVVERAKNSPTEAEKITPPTNPTIEETPTQAEETEPTPTKAVSRAELGTKVREMMTKGFKEETKAIVRDYAQTVPGVPDDKVTECYERLVALEG